MRKTIPINSSIILLMVVLGCSACERNNSKAARASRDLAQNIVQSRQPSNAVTPPVEIQEQRVYIDASASMAGFVNAANHTQFDEFIDEIGNAMPGCRLFRYGQVGETPPKKINELATASDFGLELHRTSFYNLRYNPDDILINHLADEDRPALSVIISDGVYSETGEKYQPSVVGAIKKWMERGRFFGILIMKSRFIGPFYSERGRSMLPNWAVEARPFYAFVFSPTEQAFRDLQEKLHARFQNMKAICFSDNAVTCAIALPERLKNTYARKAPPETPYYWHMFRSELLEEKNPASFEYKIKYECSPDYPASEFKFNLESQYYRWKGSGFEEVVDGAPSGFKCEIKSAGEEIAATSPTETFNSQYVIRALVARDPNSDFSFYQLNVTPAFKSLRPEIQTFSTRDDRDRKDADKTFHFFELINSLTDFHFKTRLAPKITQSLFITITNH